MAMKRVVKERIRGNLQGEPIVSLTETAAGSGSLRKWKQGQCRYKTRGVDVMGPMRGKQRLRA
jgi:hypothetical protein